MTRGAGSREQAFWPAGDICPTDRAPVLTAAAAEMELHFLRWGYPGFQKGQTLINARTESVLNKRIFRNGVQHHRAAIPCTWFYEWNKDKEKIEFYRQDSPVIYLAGFFDHFADEGRYIILTTAANASMVHTHDRMPLILEEDEVRDWVLNDRKTEELLGKVPVLLQKRSEYEQETLF